MTTEPHAGTDDQPILKHETAKRWLKQESFWQSIVTGFLASALFAGAGGFVTFIATPSDVARSVGGALALLGAAVAIALLFLSFVSRKDIRQAQARLKSAKGDESSGVSAGVVIGMVLILAALIGALLLVRSWQ